MSKAVTKATETVAERQIPVISPKMQTGNYWSSQGQAWREAFIQLPVGMVAQDLTNYPTDVWKQIQTAPNLALRRYDKVFCVSACGTWALEARVGFADLTRVVLTKPTVIALPDPKDAGLYSDDTYVVEPFPGGYVFYNKRSGARVGDTVYPTAEHAKQAVLQQYPVKRGVA